MTVRAYERFFHERMPSAVAWCHNPEGLSSSLELLLRPDRCLGEADCGACRSACPNTAVFPLVPIVESGHSGRCTVCGACAAVCPAEARQIVGRVMSIADVVRDAQRTGS